VRCLAVALACAGCLSGWQALTVHYSYGGNWTGLFCTGALFKAHPAALRSENIYLFQNSFGYDGQLYHYIAHDPFFRRNFSDNIDSPRVRYRRILVPGLAFLLALGQDRAVDAAYVVVVAGFIFLGAYWLSRMAVAQGYSVALGLLFGLVPAVLVSVDRLTVDVALAACCVGFALYARDQSPYKLYAVLAVAGPGAPGRPPPTRRITCTGIGHARTTQIRRSRRREPHRQLAGQPRRVPPERGRITALKRRNTLRHGHPAQPISPQEDETRDYNDVGGIYGTVLPQASRKASPGTRIRR